MELKYQNLLEKTVHFQDTMKDMTNSMLEVSRRMESNTKELNDKFILHSYEMKDVAKDIQEIKTRLWKMLVYTVIALLIAVGGASIVKIIGVDITNLL